MQSRRRPQLCFRLLIDEAAEECFKNRVVLYPIYMVNAMSARFGNPCILFATVLSQAFALLLIENDKSVQLLQGSFKHRSVANSP